MSVVEEGLDLYSEMHRSPVGRASTNLFVQKLFGYVTRILNLLLEIVKFLICTDWPMSSTEMLLNAYPWSVIAVLCMFIW